MGIISLTEIITFVGDFSRPVVKGSLARDNISITYHAYIYPIQYNIFSEWVSVPTSYRHASSIYKTPQEDIEEISKTNLKQSWGARIRKGFQTVWTNWVEKMTCHVSEPFSKYAQANFLSWTIEENIENSRSTHRTIEY